MSGGTTDINGGSIKTSGTQDYDNVVITPAATLTTTNSNVSLHGTSLLTAGLSVSDGTGNTTFTGTVDGAGALTVTSTGTTTFSTAVGSTTALASVSVSGGTTDINGGSVKTTGTHDYDNVVITPGGDA